MLREKHANNADARMIIQGLEKEMEIHRTEIKLIKEFVDRFRYKAT